MQYLKILSTSSILLGISYVFRFVLTFSLAKLLSSEQLGIYSWSVTAFGLLGIFVNYGVDLFLIRKIPEYRTTHPNKTSSVIEHTKKKININFSLVLLIVLPLSYFSSFHYDIASQYNTELMVIILALPFAAYLVVFSSSMRAFDFPLTGQWIESILQTGILLFLVLIFFGLNNFITFEQSMTLILIGLFVFSWIFSCLFTYVLYKKKITLQSNLKPNKKDIRIWKRDQTTIVLGVAGWSFLGRSDIFLLAFLVSPSEVGAYFICMRLGEVLTFFSTVSYYVWAGEISKLIQEKRIKQAQEILKKSSLLCLTSTLTIATFLWIYAVEILVFINEHYASYDFLFKASILVFILKASVGLLHPMYYILGDQGFLGKLQWSIGLLFTFLVITTVPIYGLYACMFSLIFCECLYVLITATRLKTTHNLSILPF